MNADKVRRQAVEVVWVDACSDREGWQPVGGEKAAPMSQKVHSIGYVTAQTKAYIQLAQSVDDEMSMSAERITIPMGCVKSIVRAHSGRQRRKP